MVAVLAAVFACLLPATASAYEDPRLGEVASVFAMQPVTVVCSTAAEDPYMNFAWGYVLLHVPVVNLDAYLCAALRDVRAGVYSLKRRALAVLVLTHEAFHLRKVWSGRSSEAQTECKAIRHVTYAAQFLGAPHWLAVKLRDHAVVFHDRLVTEHPEYHLQNCVVPRP